MKSFWFAVLLFVTFVAVGRAQSEADEKYIGIYGLIQRAEQLAQTGEPGEALAAYTDAQTQLVQFQKIYPAWNPNIVSFRLNQMADKISDLKPFTPPPRAANSQPAPATAVPSEIPTVATPSATTAAETQPAPPVGEVNDLRSALQQTQADNDQLKAKLKEALAAQPATVDARELTRAQEKIRWLMKQNDLLMASRQSTSVAQAQPIVVTNVVKVVVTNSGPVEVSNLADAFKKDQPVVVTNYIHTVVVDTNAMEMLRLERAAAVKNFNDEHDRAEQLADQLKRLQQISAPATDATNASELVALRAENAELKTQLASARSATPAPAGAPEQSAELKQALTQVAALKSENEILTLEKVALQSRFQTMLAATNASASTIAYEARIRDLTQERNDLIERLDTVNKQKSGKGADTAAQISSLNQEVTILRARLAVAEAQPVPYTPEEQALFKQNVPVPAKPEADKKSIKEMPSGTGELVASAQHHFAQREYNQAEDDYLKILDRDQNNGIALANLATIELQQGKLDDAEKHIKTALAASPDDAYNLSTMGYLKFRQEKYDEALNYLSHAAKVQPDNPEIQNYLGLTLVQLGQRKSAENALRRAIELAPNYAPAHNNLAVFYLTQQPSSPGMARWHYQKAIEAGQPRNPDLEKALADKGVPVQ